MQDSGSKQSKLWEVGKQFANLFSHLNNYFKSKYRREHIVEVHQHLQNKTPNKPKVNHSVVILHTTKTFHRFPNKEAKTKIFISCHFFPAQYPERYRKSSLCGSFNAEHPSSRLFQTRVLTSKDTIPSFLYGSPPQGRYVNKHRTKQNTPDFFLSVKFNTMWRRRNSSNSTKAVTTRLFL